MSLTGRHPRDMRWPGLIYSVMLLKSQESGPLVGWNQIEAVVVFEKTVKRQGKRERGRGEGGCGREREEREGPSRLSAMDSVWGLPPRPGGWGWDHWPSDGPVAEGHPPGSHCGTAVTVGEWAGMGDHGGPRPRLVEHP